MNNLFGKCQTQSQPSQRESCTRFPLVIFMLYLTPNDKVILNGFCVERLKDEFPSSLIPCEVELSIDGILEIELPLVETESIQEVLMYDLVDLAEIAWVRVGAIEIRVLCDRTLILSMILAEKPVKTVQIDLEDLKSMHTPTGNPPNSSMATETLSAKPETNAAVSSLPVQHVPDLAPTPIASLSLLAKRLSDATKGVWSEDQARLIISGSNVPVFVSMETGETFYPARAAVDAFNAWSADTASLIMMPERANTNGKMSQAAEATVPTKTSRKQVKTTAAKVKSTKTKAKAANTTNTKASSKPAPKGSTPAASYNFSKLKITKDDHAATVRDALKVAFPGNESEQNEMLSKIKTEHRTGNSFIQQLAIKVGKTDKVSPKLRKALKDAAKSLESAAV